MSYVIIFLLLFLTLFLIIWKIREKKEEKREFITFLEKGEKLIASFDQIAERNIDILEEKIKEAKDVIKELDERAKERENKRFPDVFRLRDEGFEIPEIAKIMNMGKAEIELILKQ
ncbi:MAG: hypothetical protein AB1630_06560 [bacterium]